MSFENPNIRSVEEDLRREPEFTHDLTDLVMEVMKIEDPEVKAFVLKECDELQSNSMRYLGFVLDSYDRNRTSSANSGRFKTHNKILESLRIVIRNIDMEYKRLNKDNPDNKDKHGNPKASPFLEWYKASPKLGGLGGIGVEDLDEEGDRERMGMWAMNDGLITLKWQLAREEAEYEDGRSEGSSTYAA